MCNILYMNNYNGFAFSNIKSYPAKWYYVPLKESTFSQLIDEINKIHPDFTDFFEIQFIELITSLKNINCSFAETLYAKYYINEGFNNSTIVQICELV